MQTTSETYKTLLAKGTNVTSKEVRATIGLDEYYQDQLVEVKTTSALMSGDNLIGNCIASTLDIKIRNPNTIPRMAQIDIKVRLDDGETQSEWLPKGTYFIDTRAIEDNVLHIVAYDAMLKTEQGCVQSGSQIAEEYTVWRLASAYVDDGSVTGATFTRLYTNKETATNAPVAGDYLSLADGVAKVSTVESDTVTWIADTSFDYPTNWPQPDMIIVGAIAKRIGVPIDARTLAFMTQGHLVQYPGIVLEDGTPKYSADGGLTMREVLGYIGVMYGGNWCISDAGALRLVVVSEALNDIDPDDERLQTITERITESGTWTVPKHLIGNVHVLAVGGGGGGFQYSTSGSSNYSAGGSGYYAEDNITLNRGENVDVTIGAGGDGGSSNENGGATEFGEYLTASGGKKGGTRNGGAGAAGGGGGYSRTRTGMSSYSYSGGAGGDSDDYSGANGSSTSSSISNLYGGGGAGAGGDANGSEGGAGITINGIVCFQGGHGYSGAGTITGGLGYDGYGDGGAYSSSGKSGLVELTYQALPELSTESLDSSPAFDAISKIVIVIGTDDNGVEQVYTAGTDTGYTLTARCPWGTQAMADNLLTALGGYVYQPFTAGGALLNPAAELGDAVYVGGVTSVVYTMDTTFDALYTADISAPQDEEIDHEYPYEPQPERTAARKAATVTAELSVLADTISSKISSADAQTLITQNLNSIRLSAVAGNNQSTVTISADGIDVKSATVSFSSIVADSVKSSWVYAGDISADQITTGTLNAANIELRNYFDVIYTSGGVTSTIGRIGNTSLTIDGVTYPGGMQLYGSTVAMLSGQSIAAVLANNEVWISSSRIYLNGDVRYTSDRNAKTDINYEDERLVALFDLILPVSFRMKADPSIDHIGFVSQDVEAAAKDAGFVGALVTTDAEGRKYLGYNELTGALAAKIKQLDKRLYQLEVQNEQ